MAKNKKYVNLSVETLVLVAVWENPFIFQGCFTITQLPKGNKLLFFFRCQSNHKEQSDILSHDFTSEAYVFTHLYNESEFIPLEVEGADTIKEYALDMLKYALHITLKEMILSRKLHFTSVDDIAMQAMINRIKPILNKQLALSDVPDEPVGFAVAMDFCPQEQMGHLAALALLEKLQNLKQAH